MSWTTPLTALPHLSDEAVAAFADGVLSGQARQRAQSHMAGCGECSDAVYGQRSASAMLRSASAPSVPSDLLDRLLELPITAELPTIRFPSGLSADGRPMFAAFAGSRSTGGPRSTAEVRPSALGPGPGPAVLAPTELTPAELTPTGFSSPGFRTAPLAPPWSGPPASPPLHSPSPDSDASRQSEDLAAHPAGPGHFRRRVSSRAGVGAAAVAALAVGMLASTAAVAGGATTTGRPAAPSLSPSSPFVPSPGFGQTRPALLTAIPSPR